MWITWSIMAPGSGRRIQDQIVAALRIWLDDPAVFNRFSEGSSHLARPLATRQIARRLMDLTA